MIEQCLHQVVLVAAVGPDHPLRMISRFRWNGRIPRSWQFQPVIEQYFHQVVLVAAVGPDHPLRMISRFRWNGRIPRSWQFQPIPVKSVLVMYTNTNTCLSNSACMKIVYRLQKHQLRSGLRDIQWNFLIGGCGRVYEGRGWDRRPAKNAIHKPWDYQSLDVAFIGRWRSDVHQCMRDQLNELICYGLQQNLIRNNVTEYYEFERLKKKY